MIKIFTITALILSSISLAGQTLSDAVRYSEILPLGTARTMGAGSAFGAMGGDFSVVGINPAGIGSFYKSELTISPGMNFTKVNSTPTNAFGVPESSSKNGIGLDNLGYVSVDFDNGRNWITSNYAIGLSKSKSFQRSFNFSGTSEGSISERWAQLADGFTPDELDNFETGPAYDAGVLIEGDNLAYDTDYFDDDIVNKSQTVEQSGYINELSVAWAGNYLNKFNLGISAGIPFISFNEEKIYDETLSIPDEFRNALTYTETLEASGVGINFKAGATYNLNPVRIGLAIHTPTWYTMEDNFSTSVDYEYAYLNTNPVDSGQGTGVSQGGNFTYNFSSPWRTVGSIGSIFKLNNIKGFINADVEYVNYRNASFNLTADSDTFGDAQLEASLNNSIDSELNSGLNFRVGSEIALSNFRLRAGYALSKNPFAGQDDSKAVSAGFGYRKNAFFFDIGYRLAKVTNSYSPYASADESRDISVDNATSSSRLVATFGFKF